MNNYRTHHCGKLSITNVDEKVFISGWLNKKRDHGGLLFIDIRDHFGVTRCVINSDHKMFKIIENIKLESVLKVYGKVIRIRDTINKNLFTGEIEILSDKIEILNESERMSFRFQSTILTEDIRLKYEFLDLRREKNHKNIILRSKVINSLRQKNDFKRLP